MRKNISIRKFKSPHQGFQESTVPPTRSSGTEDMPPLCWRVREYGVSHWVGPEGRHLRDARNGVGKIMGRERWEGLSRAEDQDGAWRFEGRCQAWEKTTIGKEQWVQAELSSGHFPAPGPACGLSFISPYLLPLPRLSLLLWPATK